MGTRSMNGVATLEVRNIVLLGLGAARVTTRHSKSPPVRRNGRTRRFPSADGDVKIAFSLGKRHSDSEASHRALTESR
eukprot:3185960-Pleurochrysis_carterae.AAC.1